MPSKTSPRYRQAAVTYAIYGVVYLAGAVWEIMVDPSRKVVHWGVVPWWVFYVVGGAFVALLPYYLWRGVRWLAGVLSALVAIKALTLFWFQGRRLSSGEPTDIYNWVFAAVAVVASSMLLRAFLDKSAEPMASGTSPDDAPASSG